MEAVNNWYDIPEIKKILDSKETTSLMKKLSAKYKSTIVYPTAKDIFKAFRLCTPDKLKVVILGQDPYHDGSAIGLAFGNHPDMKRSPSLRKILEVVDNIAIDEDPSLQTWARQGVLLLNTALTVEKSKPGSHSKLWLTFTQRMITAISRAFPDAIFLLWGSHAKAFKPLLNSSTRVLEAEHPAYSIYKGRKWDCNHFEEVNNMLDAKIEW